VFQEKIKGAIVNGEVSFWIPSNFYTSRRPRAWFLFARGGFKRASKKRTDSWIWWEIHRRV